MKAEKLGALEIQCWDGYKIDIHRAGPGAEWLSSRAPLRRPRISLVQIRSMAPLISHAEVVSHTPQLDGPTTKIYNYVLGGLEEKKQKIFFFLLFLPKSPQYIVVYFSCGSI